MANTIFTSNVSIEDAAMKAHQAGYVVIGGSQNPRTGQFVVFARAGGRYQQQQPQQREPSPLMFGQNFNRYGNGSIKDRI